MRQLAWQQAAGRCMWSVLGSAQGLGSLAASSCKSCVTSSAHEWQPAGLASSCLHGKDDACSSGSLIALALQPCCMSRADKT